MRRSPNAQLLGTIVMDCGEMVVKEGHAGGFSPILETGVCQ
jgi:hypothetical protein